MEENLDWLLKIGALFKIVTKILAISSQMLVRWSCQNILDRWKFCQIFGENVSNKFYQSLNQSLVTETILWLIFVNLSR